MGKSAGPTVGLDIGSKFIKAVELVPGRNGPTVKALGMAPTPPGAMEDSVIVDPKLLGEAVKKLLKEAGISTRRCVSSVSGQGALVVRVIEVPKMSDAELAETMKFEVERHVPFAADEVIMDFQPIVRQDDDPDAQNMEVLLAVAQQEMIDRHVAMLFAAGLAPSAIDVEPLAASRVLIELGPDPYGKKTTAIVNIGASTTDIGIYRDGILAFPRTLPLAGDAMTAAVAQQMGLEAEQAEETKLHQAEVLMGEAPVQPAAQDTGFYDITTGGGAADAGFDLGGAGAADSFDLGTPAEPQATVPAPAPSGSYSEAQLAVFSAIAPTLGELVAELRRSIEYYQGRTADGVVNEILLCGGSARLKNLDTFLSGELGIPTRVADPFQYATVSAKNYSADHIRELAPSFVVATGLAARDFVAVPSVPKQKPAKRGKK
jgi:type IV pilus assembly protein PilM